MLARIQEVFALGPFSSPQFITNSSRERWRGCLSRPSTERTTEIEPLADPSLSASVLRIWTAALLSQLIYRVDSQQSLVSELAKERKNRPWFRPVSASLSDPLLAADGAFFCVVDFDSGLRVMSFRGSDNFADWKSNGWVFPLDACSLTNRNGLHCGFRRRALDVPVALLAEGKNIGAPSHVVFTGHSLGGACAEIAALSRLTGSDVLKTTVVTFGAPSIVHESANWQNQLSREEKGAVLRLFLAEDPVPTVLNSLGFKAFEHLILLSKDGTMTRTDELLTAADEKVTFEDHKMSRYLDAILPKDEELGSLARERPKDYTLLMDSEIPPLIPPLTLPPDSELTLSFQPAPSGLLVTLSGSGQSAGITRAALRYRGSVPNTPDPEIPASSLSHTVLHGWTAKFSATFNFDPRTPSKGQETVQGLLHNGFSGLPIEIKSIQGLVNVAFVGETGHGKSTLITALHDLAVGLEPGTTSRIEPMRWTISPLKDSRSFISGLVRFYELPGLNPADPEFVETMASNLRDHPPGVLVLVVKAGEKGANMQRAVRQILTGRKCKVVVAVTRCVFNSHWREAEDLLGLFTREFGLPEDTALRRVNSIAFSEEIGDTKFEKASQGIPELYELIMSFAETRVPPPLSGKQFGIMDQLIGMAMWISERVSREDVVYVVKHAVIPAAVTGMGGVVSWYLKRL